MFTRQRYVAGDLTEHSLSLPLSSPESRGEENVSICPNTSPRLFPADIGRPLPILHPHRAAFSLSGQAIATPPPSSAELCPPLDP